MVLRPPWPLTLDTDDTNMLFNYDSKIFSILFSIPFHEPALSFLLCKLQKIVKLHFREDYFRVPQCSCLSQQLNKKLLPENVDAVWHWETTGIKHELRHCKAGKVKISTPKGQPQRWSWRGIGGLTETCQQDEDPEHHCWLWDWIGSALLNTKMS